MKRLISALLLCISSLQAMQPKFLTHVENKTDKQVALMIVSHKNLDSQDTIIEEDLETKMLVIPANTQYQLKRRIFLNKHPKNMVTFFIDGAPVTLEDPSLVSLYRYSTFIIFSDNFSIVEAPRQLRGRISPLSSDSELSHE